MDSELLEVRSSESVWHIGTFLLVALLVGFGVADFVGKFRDNEDIPDLSPQQIAEEQAEWLEPNIGDLTAGTGREPEDKLSFTGGRKGVLIEVLESGTMLFFDGKGNETSRLKWESGTMEFEGNAEESARVFFEEFVLYFMTGWLKEQLEDLPQMFISADGVTIVYDTEVTVKGESIDAADPYGKTDVMQTRDGPLDYDVIEEE